MSRPLLAKKEFNIDSKKEGSVVTTKNNYKGYKGKQVKVPKKTKCRALARTKSGTEFYKNLNNLE